MRISLPKRFTIYIGAIMAVGIALLVVYDVRLNMDLLMNLGKSESERLSNRLFEEIYRSMGNGGGRDELRAIIATFKRIEGIDEARVIHGASLDKQQGMEADEMPVDAYDMEALEGRAISVIEKAPAGYRVARFVRPVVMRSECLRCHPAREGDIGGAISVSISLAKYEAAISGYERDFVYWGTGMLLLVCSLILFMVKRWFLGPMEKLKEGAQALASGDLDYRFGILTGDEFEDAGRAFDDMAASFSRTSRRLEGLSEKHSRLVQMAADAILLKNLETGVFTDANPAATALTGYSADEFRYMTSSDVYPPERIEEYREAYRRLVHDGRGYIHDAEVRKKDGSPVPVEIAASVIEIDGKKFVQEIWRDLSERKGFEKIIRKHVEELEETVRQRTEELNNSLLALEQAYVRLQDSEQRLIQSAKLISLGEMGAGIAHELNSPLAGILSITEVLLGRSSSDDPNRLLLEKMKDAATRSKYIILDMLTYSRPTKQNFEPMYLNEAIRATLCIFISEIKTSSIRIEEDFDLKLPKIYGNKGQIMEVLLNIIKNARDAMGGGGTLYVSTWTFKDSEGEFAVAEITDTGPGIPQEIMDKIFDPFFSTKEKGGGHNIGLGLSISQSIIKEHNGRIEVESTSEGATFRIYVPLYRPQDTALTGEQNGIPMTENSCNAIT